MSDFATLIGQSQLNAAVEVEEFTLISLLKPKIFIDGDQWCVLYGEDLQSGVVGFGDSPTLATYAFNKAWGAKLPKGHDDA